MARFSSAALTPLPLDAGDLGAQGGFQVGNGLAFRRAAVQIEHARAARRVVVVDAGRQGDLVLAHQFLVEAGGIVAVEDGGEHFQGVGSLSCSTSRRIGAL